MTKNDIMDHNGDGGGGGECVAWCRIGGRGTSLPQHRVGMAVISSPTNSFDFHAARLVRFFFVFFLSRHIHNGKYDRVVPILLF